MIDRRSFLCSGMAAGAAASLLPRPVLAQPATAKPKEPTREERVAAAARSARQRLGFDGHSFSGPAWDWLVERGREAQFFLLGEQHGVAEIPKLSAALVPAGYAKLAIEVSPPMAAELDRSLANGIEGLRRQFADPQARVAFYDMREEAEFLASARAALPGGRPFLWGTDYEVAADRRLIALLTAKRKPAAAQAALAGLEQASAAAWAEYEKTRNLAAIHSFSGDPKLVAAVRSAWPRPDPEAGWILGTLQETLEINKLWLEGERYRSNERRSDFMRRNFLRYWRAEKKAGRSPKVMLKYGASHVVRGRNMSEVFDLGALVPEIAAAEGAKAFHLLVLNGLDSRTAVLDPATFTYKPGARQQYGEGLQPLLGEAWTDSFTLFDTAAIRPLLGASRTPAHPELLRTVHGFDAVLVLSGSTPSSNL